MKKIFKYSTSLVLLLAVGTIAMLIGGCSAGMTQSARRSI